MKPCSLWLSRIFFAASVTQVSDAATYNWNGSTTGGATGVSNNWDTTSANWTGASSTWPASTTADDDAVFAGAAGTVTIATGGVTANDISFQSNGYTVSAVLGAGLTLNGTTPALSVGASGTATISSVISGAAGLTKSGAGTLLLSGANNYTGETIVSQGVLRLGNGAALGDTGQGTIVGDGATLDINAQTLSTEVVTISGSGVNGVGALINNGAEQANALGRIVLGANASIGGTGRWDLRTSGPTLQLADFTLTKIGTGYVGLVAVATTPGNGNIVINQGELSAQTTTNLGGSSANTVTVNNGGTMGMWQSTIPHLWKLQLNAGGTLRAQSSSNATQNQWNGPVEISGDATFLAEGFMTIGAGITGTGNVIKNGASTTTLASTSSLGHTGNVVVNAGNLTVSGASSFVGTTTVNGGVLNLNYDTDDSSKLPDDQSLTLAGGTLALTGGTHTEEVGSLILQANTLSSIDFATRGGFFALKNVTRQSGAGLNVARNGIVITDLLNTNGMIGPWMTVSGNWWAVNSTNEVDGDVAELQDYFLSSDAALLDSASGYEGLHVLIDSSQSPDAGINPLSLIFNTSTSQTLTLQGTNTIATGGILIGTGVGANVTNINGGNLRGPENGDLVIHQRNTGVVNLNASIENNGITNLVKMGSGTLSLSGSNTYTGNTLVANGVLQVGSSTALGGTHVITSGISGSGVQLQNGVNVGSANRITISGSGIGGFFGALTTSGTATWGGDVLIGMPTGARIGTLADAGGLTIDGVISEPEGVPSELNIRSGAAGIPVTLTRANTFTGNVSVVTGTLRLNHSQALGLGNKNFNMQGTDRRLELNGGITLGSNITMNLQTNTNAGVLSVLGDNTIMGNLNLTGNASIGSNAGGSLLVSGNIIGAGAASLNFYGTSTALSLIKDDAGSWELAGANTYTGAMTVRRGTLTLSGNRTDTGTLGNITIADTAGLDATLNISNGIHNLGSNEIRVASAATTAVTGTVNQSGGQVRILGGGGNQLLLGAGTVANRGVYNLSGGSLTIAAPTNAGRGVMLGVSTGAAGGTFNLSGTGELNLTAASGGTGDSHLAIGRFDTGANNTNNTFSQTGGTANVGILSMGGVTTTSTGVTSNLSLTGGTFRANQFARLAAGNTNTANITIGGTADVTLPAFPTARGTSATATLTFDGGILRPLAASATYISSLTNALVRSGGAHISASVDITIPQILSVHPSSSGGGFTKSGSGRVNLTAANTYNGTTTVSAGILSLGTGTENTTLADTADVSIASGATLNLNYNGTDTIDELIINGQKRIAGVWGSVASGAPNTDPALTGTGTLTVTTGPTISDYDSWANGYSPAVGLATADDDGDGMSNFHEYAFGLDPKSASSVNPISQPLHQATGTFKYTRRATPQTTGVSYSYESSTTLSGTWPSFTPTSEVSNNATPVEEMTVTVPASLLLEPKLFLRVKAQNPQQ